MNIKEFYVVSFHFEENSLDFKHLKVAVFDSCTDAKDFIFNYFEKFSYVTISIRIDKLSVVSKAF